MPILFRLEPRPGLVFTTLHGVLTADDLAAYRTVLAADPAFHATFREFLDASALSSVAVPCSHLRDLARRSVFAAGARRAIYAPTPLAFGVARVFHAYYDGPVELHVFRERGEARRWLGLPKAAEGA